jgi:hypothetical protein
MPAFLSEHEVLTPPSPSTIPPLAMLVDYLRDERTRFPEVLRKVVDKGFVPAEKVEEVSVEYLKFLRLLVLNPHVPMYGAQPDAIWHEHILHSKEYIRFCYGLFGGYLFHDPAPFPFPPMHKEQRVAGFQRFKTMYEKEYGPIHAVWGAGESDECCGGHHWCGRVEMTTKA